MRKLYSSTSSGTQVGLKGFKHLGSKVSGEAALLPSFRDLNCLISLISEKPTRQTLLTFAYQDLKNPLQQRTLVSRYQLNCS